MMIGKITDILAGIDFKKLRRACYQEIKAPTSTLPDSLIENLKITESLDDLLDELALSSYWNWFDTRLLLALVSASGSPEAEKLLNDFKTTFYSKTINEWIPNNSIELLEESQTIFEKFGKNLNELTVSELLQHKYKLGFELFESDKKS